MLCFHRFYHFLRVRLVPLNMFKLASILQFEKRVKPQVYVWRITIVLCTKMLHFVNRKRRKEN